ncbi:MAG: formate dehydrogenase accessory protein FdhE [Sulfuriferula sp.]
MATTIIEPGYIQASASEPVFWRTPDAATLFGDRSQRFFSLAESHRLGDFLRFMGHLAQAQQFALNSQSTPVLPDADQIDLCKAHGMPPLNYLSLQRDPDWRDGLRAILEQVAESANLATLGAIARIKAMPVTDLEVFADQLLAGNYAELDLAAAPLIGAALQVYWVRMASILEQNDVSRTDAQNLCPVCGALPSISIVRIGGAEQGLRYLHCSLCASEWNMVRIKCSHCESTKGIAYLSIDGRDQAVKAETCDTCHSYLKILYMEKNMALNPMADDLANLTLDILVDEAGYQRSGANLLLFPGTAGA